MLTFVAPEGQLVARRLREVERVRVARRDRRMEMGVRWCMAQIEEEGGDLVKGVIFATFLIAEGRDQFGSGVLRALEKNKECFVALALYVCLLIVFEA